MSVIREVYSGLNGAKEQYSVTRPDAAQTLLKLAVIDASLEAHRKCLANLERIAADLAKIKLEASNV